MSEALHLQRGAQAEQQALEYLLSRGYRCLARNFRTRLGEIDLVMCRDELLVFVEVRYRRYGREQAMLSVRPAKCRRLWKAAQIWLARRPWDGEIRFDLISCDDHGCDHLQDILRGD